MPQFKYRAFISYSHADRAWGDWLHKALETWRVPVRLVGRETEAGVIPKSLAPIFRDRDELPSATDLGRKVNEALAQSANLIVICSPRSATSRWVNEEVLGFKRLGRADRVFCLIVDGEPNASGMPGRAAEECFAPALRFEVGADGELTDRPTEPIAADARPGKDGKGNARLKLISGLLDVGFDELRRRELQRRNRRMGAITALAVVVMAVTIALAISALIARNAAEVARQAAERRQKQAEGLVEFMLGDLNDKLGEVHRLDIMQSVDDKAMAYFASLPSADVTDAALEQRVIALEKIGSVRMGQGQMTAALKTYQAASALAAQLLGRAPDDADRLAAYADSLKWVGQVYWYQGDTRHALQTFENAGASLEKAVAAKPRDQELAFDLAAAQNNAGHAFEKIGDLAAAKDRYEAVLKAYARLRAQDPASARWQSYQGDAMDNLGKLALEEGRPAQAITAYRANQRIKATLAARDPDNHDAQENLLISDAILGRALALCGDGDSALRFTTDAVERAKKLVAFDPANASWQEYVAIYGRQLAGLQRQGGRLEQAMATVENAIRVANALAMKDATNTDWQQDLAQARLERARVQLALDEADAADVPARQALAASEKLRSESVDDRDLILLSAQAHTLLGQIAARRNDPETAAAHWRQARELIAPIARSGSDPNFLAAWASALLLLGDPSAGPPVSRLAEMGYRAPDFVALVASRHLDYPINPEFAHRIADTTP